MFLGRFRILDLWRIAGKTLRSIPYLIYRASALRRDGGEYNSPLAEAAGGAQKILVIRLDAIGDFLMTTPALRALKKRFPAARIDLLVQPGPAPMARGLASGGPAPGGEVHVLPSGFLMKGGRRISRALAWISKILELRRIEYDLVIDFTGLFHSAAAVWLSGAPLRIGHKKHIALGFFSLDGFGHFYTHQIDSKEEHLADMMTGLAVAVGASPDGGGWETPFTEEMRVAARALLTIEGIDPADKPLVIIQPGAKWAPRRWNMENYAAVIDILESNGIRTIVNAGPGEKHLIELISKRCNSSPVCLWPPVPLDTLCGLLILSDAYLGNDSGPMHMAAAAGTPVVAIFGPTSPQHTSPRGSPFTPFYSALECSPCQQYFTREKCHRGHNYCMDEFSPAEVAAAIERSIETHSPKKR